MMMDDNDGQMIFGDLAGLKLPDIHLTSEEKPRKNLTQETCPDRGSNPGPLRVKRHATTCSTAVDIKYSNLLINDSVNYLYTNQHSLIQLICVQTIYRTVKVTKAQCKGKK